jgi:type IV pilus assembly protein PilC
MSRFKYTAYRSDNPSNQISDIVEAPSREEATRMLISKGFQPLSIEPVKEGGLSMNMDILPDKVKPQDLAFFSRQLATLVGAGIPVMTALDIAARGSKRKSLKLAVDEVRSDVNQGMPLSQAMARHEKVFNYLYVSLVKAGESGDLQGALNRLAEMLELQSQQRREIRGAMVYPIGVAIFTFFILIAMMMFVVPAFQGIFAQAGSSLPAPTQLLVTASDLVRSYWYLLPLVIGGGGYAFKRWKSSDDGKMLWDKLRMNLPLGLGALASKVVTARFARTLATLQSSGVTLLQSMEIAAPTADNKVIEVAIRKAAYEVQNGRPLSAALREADVFPDLAMSMLESGERAGRVGEMLNKVAETYEDEVANNVKALKSIMEPAMMVGIGLFIGAIVVALYMPMFSIYDKIK